jgi:hypothetical protein
LYAVNIIIVWRSMVSEGKVNTLATFTSHQLFFIACASETFADWITSASVAQSMNGSISDMDGRDKWKKVPVSKENQPMCDRVTVKKHLASARASGLHAPSDATRISSLISPCNLIGVFGGVGD